jgi:hypothetical protein
MAIAVCVEKDCFGDVDLSCTDQGVTVRVGCSSSREGYICSRCNRIHFDNGAGVHQRGGAKAFLIDGQIVHREDDSSDEEFVHPEQQEGEKFLFNTKGCSVYLLPDNVRAGEVAYAVSDHEPLSSEFVPVFKKKVEA